MADSPKENDLRTGGGLEILMSQPAQGPDAMIGRQFGDYRITRVIAEGGMSFVLAAQRIDNNFDRDVAIKVSPGSLLDSRLRERFFVEQGVLASLNHPGISQLYDAAVAEEGWPFIIMELIDGVSITDYVRDQHLGLKQCLKLMADVVDAIAYAHARLVVHRDIKPSNVMVNSEGRVKVLDFGIAKLLEGDQTKLTQTQAMTPRYASPEQLLGQPVSVGSDVYQLGTLLLELLTGIAPNTDSLTSAIKRAASEVSLSLDAQTRRVLPLEVVFIIEQCLRNDPDERYRDANTLRDDIIAYVEGYPVKAVGQSAPYRFRKFVKRNLAATTIALIAVVSISASTLWYTSQLTEQRNEAQRQTVLAEESLQFLAGLFEASNPDVAQGTSLSAVDLLEIGSEKITTELIGQPEAQVKLYLTLGETLYRLGELDKAEALITQLLTTGQQLDSRYELQKLQARSLLGNIISDRGETAASLALFQQLAQDAELSLGATHPQTLEVKNNLGNAHWDLGNINEASHLYQEIYEFKAAEFGPGAVTSLTTAVNLTNLYRSLGKDQLGKTFARENLGFAEESLGPLHPISITFLSLLAMSTYVVDGVQASIPYFEEVLKKRERVYGAEGFDTARSRAQLGTFLVETGEFERGKNLQESAIRTLIALRGEEHPRVLSAKTNYASTLAHAGQHNRVLEILPTIIDTQKRVSGPRHPDTLYSRTILLASMIETNDPGAETYRLQLQAEISETFGEEHWLFKTLDAQIVPET